MGYGAGRRSFCCMSDTVQQIKDRLSIVDVVSEYVKLERSGVNLRARCPFHAERTPSFFVSPDRGTYHCFGCGVGGDIFSFIEAIEGLDFKGALKVLADKAGVEMVYSRGGEERDERERLLQLLEAATIFYSSRLDASARNYLRERGINDSTIKAFRLGWGGDGWTEVVDYLKVKKFSEKEMLDAGIAKRSERGSAVDKFRNRIMFPISDSAGRVVGFSGRIFGEKASPEAPKYLNSPETPLFHKTRILFGLDKAKLPMRKHNCAILVEGQLDLLASYQAGWGNTVAVSGTAFTPEHAARIHQLTENLVIAFDADAAGIKAAGRAARAALQAGLHVKIARLPEGLDPADLILRNGKEAWISAIRDSKDVITFLLDVLEEHSKSADGFRRSVESVVLPYLRDAQSPIAREHYVHEIARRLQVSEHAVLEAISKIPMLPEVKSGRSASEKSPGAMVEKGGGATGSGKTARARNAFAVLLWQRSLPETQLDLDAFEKKLQESISDTLFYELKALSEEEKEEMRFAGERLYGKSSALKLEVEALLNVLLKERLSRELAEATAALKRSEAEGDEQGVAVHMSVCNVLTKRIARLYEVL